MLDNISETRKWKKKQFTKTKRRKKTVPEKQHEEAEEREEQEKDEHDTNSSLEEYMEIDDDDLIV